MIDTMEVIAMRNASPKVCSAIVLNALRLSVFIIKFDNHRQNKEKRPVNRLAFRNSYWCRILIPFYSMV